MISQLIDVCRQSGIDFALGNAGKLKINADKSALTPAMLSKIKTAKTEIIAFLKAEEISELDRNFQTSVPNRAAILARLNLTEQHVEGFYPLVPLQEGMLLQHMLNDQHDAYITYFILTVEGKEVFDKVLESFKAVVDRHASCRTVIVWRGVEQAYQLVKKHVSIPIIYVQCANEGEYQQKLQALKSQNCIMDLEQDALMRFHVLIKADSQEHVLFIERHHIVSDHISLELTLYELLMFYKQQQSQLQPAKQQYEFALQNNAEKTADTGYFDELLADFEAPSLLFDINQSQFESTELEDFSYEFDTDLQRAVREQSMKSGLSPAVLFHFAWAIVMARFCNSNDVLFPTVLTGRMTSPEYRTTIGMFLNSLPLRIKLDTRSVAEHLSDINIQLMQLCQNEKVPLNRAIKKLTDEFGIVFNCIFNYRHSTEEVFLDELPFEHIVSKDESSTPFSLSISETGEAFSAELEAYKGTNGIALLDGLVLALEYIVNELTEDSKAPFQMPILLPDDMVQHLVYDLNDTVMDYPKDKCIHTLFEQQAQEQPDNVAVVFEEKQLTYKQLNEKANQLAHYLKQHHEIKPDTLIGLCVERSLEMVIGILGILKAGGAYVPLDPSYPKERLSYMLEDTGLDVVLSQIQVQDVLADFNGTTLVLDGVGDTENHLCSDNNKGNLRVAETGLTSSNLAYVIYTSGSTGQPKGVLIAHSSVNNLVYSQKDTYQIDDSQNEIGLVLASYAFDAAVEQIFVMLLTSNTLIVPSTQELLEPEKLLKLIMVYQVTHIDSTPSHLVSIINCLNYQSINRVISGGEAMLPQLWDEIGPDITLYNVYGPTEACVTSSVSLSRNSIGKPVGNTEFYLLNDSLHLTPKGTVGELFIGGDGLSRGYLNRPALTAERFIDNPLYDESKPNSSARLYRTGDLVRYLPDGNLEFLGRVDDQVKVRGFRIELGEVEVQLTQLEAVDSALVMARELVGSQQLVGYVKPEGGLEVTSQANFIKQALTGLKAKLPDYMIPDILMVIEEWPLTPNGKVDRKALPKPDGSLIQDEYVAPETETEKTIVGQIAGLIGIDTDKISVSESFLNLGGNSILSLRLSQSLANVLEIEPPLLLILESNSIKELSLELDLILSVNNTTHAKNTENLIEEEW